MENQLTLGQIVHWRNGCYFKGTLAKFVTTTHAEVQSTEVWDGKRWTP
jgi:hypothetical protein